ncbi:MAG: glycosyltransferase family 1 protein [Candidatus Latescibacteria bacterium]|nr:glycosyltransferase family 1 protein [Candidatus Latescibacterota bacterium]
MRTETQPGDPSGSGILLISPFCKPNVGGAEAHLDKLSKYLDRRGHRVWISTYQPLVTPVKAPSYEREGGIETFRISWFGRGWFNRLEHLPFVFNFLYLFPGLFVNSLRVALRHRRQIRVVHAHGLVATSIAKILARLFAFRSVASTHAIYGFGRRMLLAKIVRWLFASFDYILAVGEPSRQELIQIGLPADRIEVHPNWVDLRFFRPHGRSACRQMLNIQGEFVVLFIGRLIEIKGVRQLLEAARDVPPQITFYFIGDGPLASEVEEASRQSPNIFFIGKIPSEEAHKIPYYYGAADLAAFPSQYDEGFATVLLESIACGTPVISCDRGVVPYFLTPEVSDLIDPTVENLRERILYYFQNRRPLEEKQRACRAFAEERFSEEKAKIIEKSYGLPE